eukprot:TRINITY_DN1650_c0_g1_i11.p1 TRINITY_DN1650_c0_g1~~TRINITY_DN1650_c0_g1_i11.p1  ORF type:complete len:863 (-),score=153.84 TRINITY_DN1650_c0_g1_i11:708-3296(-)
MSTPGLKTEFAYPLGQKFPSFLMTYEDLSQGSFGGYDDTAWFYIKFRAKILAFTLQRVFHVLTVPKDAIDSHAGLFSLRDFGKGDPTIALANESGTVYVWHSFLEDRPTKIRIPLGIDEGIRHLVLTAAETIVVTTTHGRLFWMPASEQARKIPTEFYRSKAIYLMSFIKSVEDDASIYVGSFHPPITPGQAPALVLWTENVAHVWALTENSAPKFVAEINVLGMIQSVLLESCDIDPAEYVESLQIVDIRSSESYGSVILVSCDTNNHLLTWNVSVNASNFQYLCPVDRIETSDPEKDIDQTTFTISSQSAVAYILRRPSILRVVDLAGSGLQETKIPLAGHHLPMACVEIKGVVYVLTNRELISISRGKDDPMVDHTGNLTSRSYAGIVHFSHNPQEFWEAFESFEPSLPNIRFNFMEADTFELGNVVETISLDILEGKRFLRNHQGRSTSSSWSLRRNESFDVLESRLDVMSKFMSFLKSMEIGHRLSPKALSVCIACYEKLLISSKLCTSISFLDQFLSPMKKHYFERFRTECVSKAYEQQRAGPSHDTQLALGRILLENIQRMDQLIPGFSALMEKGSSIQQYWLIGSVDDRWVHLGMFVEIISLLLIELIAHRVKPYHSFLVFDFPECWTAQESFTYHLLKMNLSVLEKAEGLVYREGSNAELYKSFIHILNAFFTASLWILSRGKVEAHKIATLAKNVCHLCHQLNDPQATKYAEKISFEYGQLDVIIERYYVGDTFKFEEFMVHVQKTQRLDLVQEMARTFIRRGAIHLLFAFNDESYHAQIELALKDNPQVGILWFLNKQKYDRAYSLALENLHNKQTPQEFKTFADLAKVAFFSNPKGASFRDYLVCQQISV